MKNILALFFLSFSTFSFTQESLEPLKTNYKLINGFNNIRSSNITNNGFIYLTDTISLPVIDDFSTNKFKNYLTDTSLSNISDSVGLLFKYSYVNIENDSNAELKKTSDWS